MSEEWNKAISKIESVIDVLSETPGGSYVDTLTRYLDICRDRESLQDKQFQEAAEALYQLLTHPRGVSDIFVEEFTLGEWVTFLFDAAKSIEPFIDSRKTKKIGKPGRKSRQ